MRGNCPPFLAQVDEEDLFDFDSGVNEIREGTFTAQFGGEYVVPANMFVAEGNRNAYFVQQDAVPGAAAIRSSHGKSIPYEIGTQRTSQSTQTVTNLSSASNKAANSKSYNATSLR
jgi:hypothetical protein